MDYTEYRKKLKGCYTGKAVGGTLGMPFEGRLDTRVITGYDPVPDKMAANDDLDLQVIDLEIVRRYGLPVNRHHLSTLWEHLQDGGPDEYGAARWNVALKRYAPLSGYYCNKFYAGMGAAIRSELWACLAPGDPALAVRLAREDACSDHYADGVDACVFLTAVESAAFTESDTRKLLETGFSFIDPKGRLSRGLRDSARYYEETGDPCAARELLLKNYYVQNWTDVTLNLGLTVISWLASEGDFGRAICIAAGLGYDADCTCATLGSIMGIIDPDSIGCEWTAPIGDRLVLSCSIMGIHEPETVGGFCDLVAETAVDLLRWYRSPAALTGVPVHVAGAEMHAPWAASPDFVSPDFRVNEAMTATVPLGARLIYPEAVALRPEKPGKFTLILKNPADVRLCGSFTLSPPEGWRVEPRGFGFGLDPGEERTFGFEITSPALEKRRPRDNDLDIDFTSGGLKWKVTAGLALSIPWLRKNLVTGEVETLEADEVFQTVPAGEWRYSTAVKLNPFMPASMGVMSERAFTAKLNGAEVLSGDGSFYVPAYHRGKTVTNVRTGKVMGQWNIVEIDVKNGVPGELFFGFARPHNCREWLIGAEYSLAPFEGGEPPVMTSAK